MSKLTNMNEMAIQQFTGYHHAYTGFSVSELATSMGLDAEEWEVLKPEMPWLDKHLVAELDEHYEEQTDEA